MPDDSKKSNRELLDEYSRILTFFRRHKYLRRTREIIEELGKRKNPSLHSQPPKDGAST